MTDEQIQFKLYGFVEDVPADSMKAKQINLARLAVETNRPHLIDKMRRFREIMNGDSLSSEEIADDQITIRKRGG